MSGEGAKLIKLMPLRSSPTCLVRGARLAREQVPRMGCVKDEGPPPLPPKKDKTSLAPVGVVNIFVDPMCFRARCTIASNMQHVGAS